MLQWNVHSLVTRPAVPVYLVKDWRTSMSFCQCSSLVCSGRLTKSRQCQGPWRWTNFLQNLPVMKIRLKIRFSWLGIFLAEISGVMCNAPSRRQRWEKDESLFQARRVLTQHQSCFISAEVFWSGWGVGRCRCCKSELVLVGSKRAIQFQSPFDVSIKKVWAGMPYTTIIIRCFKNLQNLKCII